MKRLFFSIFFFFTLAFSAYSQKANHVILISIDGFRPEFYLNAAWPAPVMQGLLSKGAYAVGVNSIFPSVTYPAHTTLVTGALPTRHGVYYNAPFGAPKDQWYWDEKSIKTPTLWDAIRQAGLTSGAVMWPVTVGAPIDYNFPVRRDDTGGGIDQLTITLPLVSPRNLIAEMEKKTGKKLGKQDFNHHHVDNTIAEMSNHIIAAYKPNLMAIHFLGVDHLAHEFGRDGAAVKAAVAQIDSLIGSVLVTLDKAGIKNNTTIIITGDHGFANTTTAISPNVWLAREGLLNESQWKAKFVAAGGSTFLYLKNKQDKATLRQVNKMLADLPEDQKKLFRVLNRKDLDAAGANPEVSLALALRKGVVANNNLAGEVVKKVKKGGSHGYFPDFPEIRTGFIAVGAGVHAGVVVPEMGIKDVSPLIARLLNLDFKAPDGVLIPKILIK